MPNKKLLENIKNTILDTSDINTNIKTIRKYAKEITGAARCSLFIYNKEKDQLKSIYADGVQGNIVLKSNIGIVGYAFHKKISILENDTANSPIFFKAVDQKINYKTETILAIPLLSDQKRLGVIELLNKKEGFTEEDKNFMESLSQILTDLLHPQAKKNSQEKSYQTKLDTYLDTKKLYLMENGSAYYKILSMKRDYFIAADICYQLDITHKKTELFYHTIDDDFLSINILAKIDSNAKEILISESIHQENFMLYTLEEDEHEI